MSEMCPLCIVDERETHLCQRALYIAVETSIYRELVYQLGIEWCGSVPACEIVSRRFSTRRLPRITVK